ncbi:hypothetical protein M1439_01265 [Candidatus Marsarchaeota archaeon]|jgi:E3 ubiquitin-protein ligase DOA10|nr:hypothetical protein [Candidatus Marsarchaeota archaeon]MCL5092680.1 hypothetical protein [Candidatus Marsarchaeota archaeon]
METTIQKPGLSTVGKNGFLKKVYELRNDYEKSANVTPAESKAIQDIIDTFNEVFNGQSRNEAPRDGYKVLESIYNAEKVVRTQALGHIASNAIRDRLISLNREDSLANILLALESSDLERTEKRKLDAGQKEQERQMADLQKRVEISALLRRKKDSARRAVMQE